MGSRRRSSKRSSASSVGFFSVFALILAAAAGGFWLTRNPAPPHKRLSAPPPPTVNAPSSRERTVQIFVVKLIDNDARLMPVKRKIRPGVDPHEAAIEALIATNKGTGPLAYLIPKGTKSRGVTVRDDIAYADFSSEIRDNFSGGSMNEALLVNSIIHTLTQFDDVKEVQILVEGQKIDSIGGHLDASEPGLGDSTLLYKGDEE